MRGIKFRIYDPKLGMDYDPIVSQGKINSQLNNPLGCVIMQYTGLKDKNGKEIYEGDIVKATNFYHADLYYEEYTGKVIFYESEFITNPYIGSLFNLVENYHAQVIGNIYENPELIKDKEPSKFILKIHGKEVMRANIHPNKKEVKHRSNRQHLRKPRII